MPATWAERYSERAEEEKLPQRESERRELMVQVARDGRWLLRRLEGVDTPEKLRSLPEITTLRTVWEQQFVFEGEGEPVWRPTDEIDGKEVICTPHDPEARYGEKRGRGWVGYKLHLTETVEPDLPHLITDVQTTPAPVEDTEVVEDIQQQLAKRELLPGEQLADTGYIAGHTLASSEERGVKLMGPARPDTSPQARMEDGLTIDDFKVDLERREAICPAGERAKEWWEGKDAYGRPVVRIRFARQTCEACPLRARCVTGEKSGRSLQWREHHELVAARRREQETEAFKEVYRLRPGVEGTLAVWVTRYGGRYARYVGLAKVHLRHLFMAAAINLKRAIRWLTGKGNPKPRRLRLKEAWGTA